MLLPHIYGVTKPPPRFESKGLFDMGKISFRIDSTLQGRLLDDEQTKINILIDTGATRAIVNKSFYDETPSLHIAPTFKLENPSLIRTPSQINPYMLVEECVLLLIEIQGHVFKIYAYILPHMDVTYDLILGQKPLYANHYTTGPILPGIYPRSLAPQCCMLTTTLQGPYFQGIDPRSPVRLYSSAAH